MARRSKGTREYSWRGTRKYPVKPQAAGMELERLNEELGRPPKPQEIVEAAKKRTSPIHKCFTWNDSKAANLRRLDEARSLARDLCVVIVGVVRSPAPAFHYVRTKSDAPGARVRGGYAPLAVAMTDPDMRSQLLERAKEELRRFQEKYKELKELAPVFAAIRKVA